VTAIQLFLVDFVWDWLVAVLVVIAILLIVVLLLVGFNKREWLLKNPRTHPQKKEKIIIEGENNSKLDTKIDEGVQHDKTKIRIHMYPIPLLLEHQTSKCVMIFSNFLYQ
jgi:hypothetical protein